MIAQEIFFSIWFLYIVALLGMLTHFLKKKVRGETATQIKKYFSTHFKSTFLALILTSIGFLFYYFNLAKGTYSDFITVFGIGYMFDSMLNKWEKEEGQ